MNVDIELEMYTNGRNHGLSVVAEHSGLPQDVYVVEYQDERMIRLVNQYTGTTIGVPKDDPFGLGLYDAYKAAGLIRGVTE
jgi:hypothetical protein